jgi:hypothetical protein
LRERLKLYTILGKSAIEFDCGGTINPSNCCQKRADAVSLACFLRSPPPNPISLQLPSRTGSGGVRPPKVRGMDGEGAAATESDRPQGRERSVHKIAARLLADATEPPTELLGFLRLQACHHASMTASKQAVFVFEGKWCRRNRRFLLQRIESIQLHAPVSYTVYPTPITWVISPVHFATGWNISAKAGKQRSL